jgi:hypothetical protein
MGFPNKSTQFRPGNPGGPGRPRKRPITERLIEQLAATRYEGWEFAPGETVADLVAQRWIHLIIDEQDVTALRELLARLEGRIPLKIQADAGSEDDDHDFEEILASLGLEWSKQGRDQAAAGAVKPGRVGGGRKQGKVEASASPKITRRKAGRRREENRTTGKPAPSSRPAAKTRQK